MGKQPPNVVTLDSWHKLERDRCFGTNGASGACWKNEGRGADVCWGKAKGVGAGKAGRGVAGRKCSMNAHLDCANHRHVEEQWNEGGPQAPLQGDV